MMLLVPTLRVGMHPVTLRVTNSGTQSVPGGIPTRSVGTISQQPLNATCGRSPAKKNGRNRTPTLFPINAATTHTSHAGYPTQSR